MKSLFEGHDYSELKREIETLRQRIEELECGQARRKEMGRSSRWRGLLKRPAFAVPAVIVAVLAALGILSAQNQQNPLFIDEKGRTMVGGDLNLGNSIVYFTNTNHTTAATALPDGVAAIENAKDLGALAIFGRSTPARRRVVAINDRLGIGTSFPNAALDVGGSAVVSADLTVPKIQGIVSNATSGARNVSLLDRVAIGKDVAAAPLDVKGEIRGKLWTSQEYKWSQNQGSPVTQMTRADRSVCFLMYARGLQGWGESVEIKQNDKGYWVLTGSAGRSDFKVEASARCIGAPDDSW